MRRAAAGIVLVLAPLAGAADVSTGTPEPPAAEARGPAAVAEPDGYRGEPYRAPVPATLEGAVVLDDAGAHRLWATGAAVFVDVLPRAPKPDLPEGTLWHEPERASIPGAIWLPNTGYEALHPETLGYFLGALAEATAGEADRPLVFFCMADCWMSWNAAKRALAHGFTAVHWYPAGTDGWRAAGHPLEPVQPVPSR